MIRLKTCANHGLLLPGKCGLIEGARTVSHRLQCVVRRLAALLQNMSEKNDKDLKRTQELYDFLQGKMPKGTHVATSHRPKLTPDQAWQVVWYLGNQYWQVTDRVEKCCVCGTL